MTSRPRFAFSPLTADAGLELECSFRFDDRAAARLTAHATRLRRSPAELVETIVARVIEDDLVVAVLDEGPSS